MLKNNLKRFKMFLLCFSLGLGSSGCAKSDCSVGDDHVHLYTKGGYKRYIESEYLTCDGFSWNEEYKYLNRKDIELQKFLDKKNLFCIDLNEEVIKSVLEQREDYFEYEYKYDSWESKTTYNPVTEENETKMVQVEKKAWTTDANHFRLTGRVRLCHPVYQAYRVEKNEKGKYICIKSSLVDDVLAISSEYPYINRNYCQTAYTYMSLYDVMSYERIKK